MSYTPTTWATGDTITAAKLNNIEDGIAEAAQSGGGGWDAVIRLTHADNSGPDNSTNLTPSIVEGTYAGLAAKISGGGCPCILVEYSNPFMGTYYSAPMGFVSYISNGGISIAIAGPFFYLQGVDYDTPFGRVGNVTWTSSDTIAWY